MSNAVRRLVFLYQNIVRTTDVIDEQDTIKVSIRAFHEQRRRRTIPRGTLAYTVWVVSVTAVCRQVWKCRFIFFVCEPNIVTVSNAPIRCYASPASPTIQRSPRSHCQVEDWGPNLWGDCSDCILFSWNSLQCLKMLPKLWPVNPIAKDFGSLSSLNYGDLMFSDRLLERDPCFKRTSKNTVELECHWQQFTGHCRLAITRKCVTKEANERDDLLCSIRHIPAIQPLG